MLSESVNGKTMIVAKKRGKHLMFVGIDSLTKENVVEGKYSVSEVEGEGLVEMLTEPDVGCAFCVLSGLGN